jgi:hypothetical protein
VLFFLFAADAFHSLHRRDLSNRRPGHGFNGFDRAEGFLFLLFRHGKQDLTTKAHEDNEGKPANREVPYHL